MEFLSGYIVRYAFVNGWFLVLWNVYMLVQRLGDCWGVVIRLTTCKIPHNSRVPSLCGRLVVWSGSMGLLIWLMAEPSGSDGYLNWHFAHNYPTPTTPHSNHPSYVQLMILDLCKVGYSKTNKSNWLLVMCLFTES